MLEGDPFSWRLRLVREAATWQEGCTGKTKQHGGEICIETKQKPECSMFGKLKVKREQKWTQGERRLDRDQEGNSGPEGRLRVRAAETSDHRTTNRNLLPTDKPSLALVVPLLVFGP